MAAASSDLAKAFVAPANLLGLASAGAAAAYTSDPMPAFVALGVEAIYLLVMSALGPFRRSRRRRSGTAPDLEALLDELSESQREHVRTLEALRDKILANYERLPGGRVLSASSAQRLDALLSQFVRLVVSLNHYRQFLGATDRKSVERELAALKQELATDESERVREVKRRRVEILDKRLARFRQAEESREIVSHQLAAIEDLLKLTHEQSIAIRDPEAAAPQLEALTAETQATEESVREMERFLDIDETSGPHFASSVRVRSR